MLAKEGALEVAVAVPRDGLIPPPLSSSSRPPAWPPWPTILPDTARRIACRRPEDEAAGRAAVSEMWVKEVVGGDVHGEIPMRSPPVHRVVHVGTWW